MTDELTECRTHLKALVNAVLARDWPDRAALEQARAFLARTEPKHPAVESARTAYARYVPREGQGPAFYFYDGYYKGYRDGMDQAASLSGAHLKPDRCNCLTCQIFQRIRDAAALVPRE